MRNKTGNDADGEDRGETARQPKRAPATAPRGEAGDENGGKCNASPYAGKMDGRKVGPASCTEAVEHKS